MNWDTNNNRKLLHSIYLLQFVVITLLILFCILFLINVLVQTTFLSTQLYFNKIAN